MKYYKVIFNIVNDDKTELDDSQLAQNVKDVLCAYVADAGFESFEEYGNKVCGYVQTQNFDVESLETAINALPFGGVSVGYEVTEAEDKDWNSKWESAGFEPMLIKNRCVIHDTLHPVEAVSDSMLDVVIEAKQAFGTGTHETTQMIVGELLDSDLHGSSVLDCGCGTGILSIVASKLGAQSVCAYDIDEWSVRNTEHNCALNGVANVDVIEGTAEVISRFNKDFDIVLANINRNILLADMQDFYAAMAQNALLVLSGFYVEDAGLLKDKAASLGLDFVKAAESANWCMLAFRKTKQRS